MVPNLFFFCFTLLFDDDDDEDEERGGLLALLLLLLFLNACFGGCFDDEEEVDDSAWQDGTSCATKIPMATHIRLVEDCIIISGLYAVFCLQLDCPLCSITLLVVLFVDYYDGARRRHHGVMDFRKSLVGVSARYLDTDSRQTTSSLPPQKYPALLSYFTYHLPPSLSPLSSLHLHHITITQ
jgi:hypothetical protein